MFRENGDARVFCLYTFLKRIASKSTKLFFKEKTVFLCTIVYIIERKRLFRDDFQAYVVSKSHALNESNLMQIKDLFKRHCERFDGVFLKSNFTFSVLFFNAYIKAHSGM